MLANLIRRTAVFASNRPPILSSVRRGLAQPAYEGDGKMTVHIINQELDLGLMIDTYGTYGFKLNNGITVLGPMAIFPRSVLSWQVERSADVTLAALRLFTLLEPRIDLLVMGLETADRSEHDRILRLARSAKINVELLTTEHACSTFNFLNAEGRNVCGALIPPLHITNVSEDDMLRSQLYHHDIYNKELVA